MEWDLSQGDSFVRVSTHGKSISVLRLITEIVFCFMGSGGISVMRRGSALPLHLPALSFWTLAGGSSCPKITIIPPFLKSSTTTLIDQNVSDEEAQGINGKTPAKYSAASPKPQGTLIGGSWHRLGTLFTSEGNPEEWWPLRKSFKLQMGGIECIYCFQEKSQSENPVGQSWVFPLLLKHLIHFSVIVLFMFRK